MEPTTRKSLFGTTPLSEANVIRRHLKKQESEKFTEDQILVEMHRIHMRGWAGAKRAGISPKDWDLQFTPKRNIFRRQALFNLRQRSTFPMPQ